MTEPGAGSPLKLLHANFLEQPRKVRAPPFGHIPLEFWKPSIMEKSLFWYSRKMNPWAQFQRSQIFDCKVEEENTQIFLHSKVVYVLHALQRRETKAVSEVEINDTRSGVAPESWGLSLRNYRLSFRIIRPCVAQLPNNLERIIMWGCIYIYFFQNNLLNV